jgi:hypothetical protein
MALKNIMATTPLVAVQVIRPSSILLKVISQMFYHQYARPDTIVAMMPIYTKPLQDWASRIAATTCSSSNNITMLELVERTLKETSL